MTQLSLKNKTLSSQKLTLSVNASAQSAVTLWDVTELQQNRRIVKLNVMRRDAKEVTELLNEG